MEKILDLSYKFLWEKETSDILEKQLSISTEIVDLTTNHVTGKSIDILIKMITSENSCIKILNLTSCRLTVEDSKNLCSNISKSQLRHLVLDKNLLVEEVCQIIGEAIKNGKLETLSLSGCDISCEGIRYIATALQGNKLLHTLDLSYNQIFDNGALILANFLPKSHIRTLLIGHSKIWESGTESIINCLSTNSINTNNNNNLEDDISVLPFHIDYLDIGGNIVNLINIPSQIQTTGLKGLSLSDSKVDQQSFGPFLQQIGYTGLRTLIMESIDFKPTPIRWGKGRENIWDNNAYFDILLHILSSNENSITDLRVGYLSLNSLHLIENALQANSHELLLTLSDFGQSGETWVMNYPSLSLAAPSSKFTWRSHISIQDTDYFGVLFPKIVYRPNGNEDNQNNGKSIEIIDIKNCQMDDDLISHFLSVLLTIITQNSEIHIHTLEVSDNTYGNNVISSLNNFLQNIPPLLRLSIGSSSLENSGMELFLQNFVENPQNAPVEIEITFVDPLFQDSSEQNLNVEHSAFSKLGEVLQLSQTIKRVIIHGPITGKDGALIARYLGKCESIEELILAGDIPEAYKRPQSIGPLSQHSFKDAISSFYNALMAKDSKSHLKVLEFPVLTQYFLSTDEAQVQWGEIKSLIEGHNQEN